MGSKGSQARIEFLLHNQNVDGGWGYFPGRQSWLEPTFWAVLAMTGRQECVSSGERAWGLLRSWQTRGGGCRPNRSVDAPNWATALWVTLHCIHGSHGPELDRAVEWMVAARGTEGTWWRRTLRSLMGERDAFDAESCGWAWWPGTSSWLEPTVHGLIALKKVAAAGRGGATTRARAAEAERMLLDRRCADGGWNYGVREALGHALPSYPETTGLALIALAGNPDPSVRKALTLARGMLEATRSSMARAWLTIALRIWGERVEAPVEELRHPDIMVAALEAAGDQDGNYRLLLAKDSVR